MSVPHSNSTQTIEIPLAVEERTLRTPVAPFTAVSTGKVTSLSTSSGAIPWASVITVTVGAVRSGKISTGMSRTTNIPAIKSANEETNTIRRCLSAPLIIASNIIYSFSFSERVRETELLMIMMQA